MQSIQEDNKIHETMLNEISNCNNIINKSYTLHRLVGDINITEKREKCINMFPPLLELNIGLFLFHCKLALACSIMKCGITFT